MLYEWYSNFKVNGIIKVSIEHNYAKLMIEDKIFKFKNTFKFM